MMCRKRFQNRDELCGFGGSTSNGRLTDGKLDVDSSLLIGREGWKSATSRETLLFGMLKL